VTLDHVVEASLAAHDRELLHSAFADWADVAAGRADARALMLRRRLRPRGSLRVPWALPRIMA
jgi:hypothetical protein